VDKDEQHDRQPEQDRDRGQDAPDDVLGHEPGSSSVRE
jgi:hypothetical protein